MNFQRLQLSAKAAFVLVSAGQVLAQDARPRSEVIWIGALAWTLVTLFLVGISGAFMATDWQLWIGRARQKRWMTGIVSVSLLTAAAVGVGIAGITVGWANLATSKGHKNTQDTYSSMLALYLAAHGFLIFFGFAFFNRKSLAWGVIFWLLVVASAVATAVLSFWISNVAFGLLIPWAAWLFILGIILFWAFRRNQMYASDETIYYSDKPTYADIESHSHHHHSSGHHGHHHHSSSKTRISYVKEEPSTINFD